jgi:alpha-1,6-mannosyltransferase
MTRKLWLLGTGIVLLTLAGTALHRPGAIDAGSDARKLAFAALLVVATGLYFVAVSILLRRAEPVVPVLAVAAAMHLVAFAAPPFLSSDIYRYVWDGRVQNAGINPFRYKPDDPALAALRDTAIFPHVTRAATARTIYPPAAQIVFAAVGRLVPGAPWSLWGVKAAMLLAMAVAVAAALRLLALAGLPLSRVAILAWNPLAAWEYAGNGHVDAVAIALVGLAMLALARRRAVTAGAWLGGAILVKFLPAVLAPAFWRRGRWRAALACVVVMVLLYLPYLGAGKHVLGYLGGYPHDAELDTSQGFYLLQVVSTVMTLPRWAPMAYALAGLAVLGVLAWRVAASGPDASIEGMAADVLVLAGALIVVASPHYGWYFPWLALPACLVPRPWAIALAALPAVFYFDELRADLAVRSLVYLPVAALALREYLAGTRRRPA